VTWFAMVLPGSQPVLACIADWFCTTRRASPKTASSYCSARLDCCDSFPLAGKTRFSGIVGSVLKEREARVGRENRIREFCACCILRPAVSSGSVVSEVEFSCFILHRKNHDHL